MKLLTSPTSPYGRKCRMAAYVAGVAERVAVSDVDYKSAEYRAINPLNKVPALVLEDGRVIIDSPVICAFLADVGDGAVLYPQGDDKWASLGLEALADGVTDAGVLIFLERRRDANPQSDAWIALQTGKVNAGLDVLEDQADTFGTRADIGVLAAYAAVAWLEFRDVVAGIRDGRPNLSAWMDAMAARDFASATAPEA